MPKRKYPTGVVRQAEAIIRGFDETSTTLAFGTVNAASLTADIHTATAQHQAQPAQYTFQQFVG